MLLRSTLPPVSARSGRSLRAAFTLLEVLVVVAIIVMLAGVGGYYLLPQLEAAKVSRAKSDVNALSQLVDTYHVNNDQYPGSMEALTQPQPNGGSALCSPDKIRDPWGKVYQINPAGPHNQGNKADIFTTSPKGVLIGNFTQ